MHLEGEDLKRLLNEIRSQLRGAGFNTVDAVCYGSVESVRKARNEEQAILAISDAIPQKIWDEFQADEKRAQADELRRKASEIEASI
ncbi:hypothetical protein [Roseibium sp. Sym1]|uniref:hypothetical protein n=1 Tax=Roseibium sp. Sym1 TaxID=3016006 RepID=UPI0022B2B1D1|nr:hypothetical protein [Roseibium sp. Sym1]